MEGFKTPSSSRAETEKAAFTTKDISSESIRALEEAIEKGEIDVDTLTSLLGEAGFTVQSETTNGEHRFTLSWQEGDELLETDPMTAHDAFDFLRSTVDSTPETVATNDPMGEFINETREEIRKNDEDIHAIAQAANTFEPPPEERLPPEKRPAPVSSPVPGAQTDSSAEKRQETPLDEATRALLQAAGDLRERGFEPRKQAAENLVRRNDKPPQRSREHREKMQYFDERFTNEFGIAEKDLRSIEGFDTLSRAQQKLVYENFVQCALGNLRAEAAYLCAAEGHKREQMTKALGTTLGAAIEGFRDRVTRQYDRITMENERAAMMKKGGFKLHKELLTHLIESISVHGPRVHEAEKGELVIDLVHIERAADRETKGEEWKAMTNLNAAAHTLSRIPGTWRAQTALEEGTLGAFMRETFLRSRKSRQEKAAYEDAEMAYENAKKSLESVLLKKGIGEREIAEILLGIDERVHLFQTLRTDTQAVEELSRIKDKNFWKESALNFMRREGAYLSLGFVGRTLATAGITYAGAILASMAVASRHSWNHSEAELRDRDRSARSGVHDSSEGALNIVDAHNLKERLEMVLQSCRTANPEQKPRALADLRARIEYTHDKQMLHRVNYGERNERVTNLTNLVEKVSEALVYLVQEEREGSSADGERLSAVLKRLDRYQDRIQSKIDRSREAIRWRNMKSAAGNAALYSVAGFMLGGIFRSE